MFSEFMYRFNQSVVFIPTVLTLFVLMLCLILRAAVGPPPNDFVSIPYIVALTFCVSLLAELYCRRRF